MASVGRTLDCGPCAGPRGIYGMLRTMTAGKRSGRMSAAFQATLAPQSWPTMIACLSPSASSKPTMSPTRWRMVYEGWGGMETGALVGSAIAELMGRSPRLMYSYGWRWLREVGARPNG